MFKNELVRAVSANDINKAMTLIEQGWSANGDDLLHTACRAGYLEMVSLLIFHGANVNTPCDKFLLTPLHYAVGNNRPFIVKVLLMNGANPNQRDSSRSTCIFYANTDELVNILMEKVDHTKTSEIVAKDTCLHMAMRSRYYRPHVIETDINMSNNHGHSVLVNALIHRFDCLSSLLLHGASMRDIDWNNPITMKIRPHYIIMHLLYENIMPKDILMLLSEMFEL